ncbi:malonate transporter [Variovorax boronicumulans]|uniref:AEC family transporter n=1 Tax=Variovorax boronicumulans TaxID=436515 RepID=UPI002476380F|nr:AEC family transporter [Variovorax boronicumulans]MDH6168208.1 malonate transporter [Variovorax boronicumulans]
MLETVNYAQLLFPDFSLIAIGWLLCRYTALDRRVWDQVESLVYYFLFPVLLFHSIVRSPLDFGATSSLLTAGVGVGLCGIALAYALPFVPGIGTHIDRRDHAASAQVGFRFNSFICLALADRLAGPEGLLLIAVLIGVCVPMFNIAAVWPMTRHAQTGFVRQLVRNPLIVATVAGLLANVLGFTVPNWLTPTLTRIGAASLALGLLAAGAGMQFATLGRGKVLAVSVLAIRHLILPLVAWVLGRALRLDGVQASVLMAFSAVPTASSAYVLAARMGYNGPYVAGLVTLSTVLGVASLPFALALPR